MAIISSISGLRFTEDSYSDELIQKYIYSIKKIYQTGKIAIGRDGRHSGAKIESMISDLLSKIGFEPIVLGIVPTPTVQLAVERFDCIVGIVITASHNPKEWNGLKFINRNGTFFDKHENEVLWSHLEDNYSLVKDSANEIIYNYDMIDFHINSIISLNIIKSNLDSIKYRNFKVAVDAVNSSGSIIVPKLLKHLGCEVLPLYCENNGEFPHYPEPLPANLISLSNFVKENNCDIGIAVDPDADRLVLIDENGDCIGEEKTICIAIDSVLNKHKGNVVVNLSTTSLADFITKSHNCNIYKSPVGEINVVNKMKETNAIIGGEGSGGVIFAESHYGRDSLVGIVLLLNILTDKKCSLKQLVNQYPSKVMIKTKQNFDGNFKIIENKIFDNLKEYQIDNNDGIRIDFDDKWVQIRKSNTEPIIRIISETETENEAIELIDKISKLISN